MHNPDALLLRLLAAPTTPADAFTTVAHIEAQTDVLRALATYLNAARMVLEDYEKLDRAAERALPALPAPIAAYLKELR